MLLGVHETCDKAWFQRLSLPEAWSLEFAMPLKFVTMRLGPWCPPLSYFPFAADFGTTWPLSGPTNAFGLLNFR